MSITKRKVDIQRIRAILENDRPKKRAVQEALGIDRYTMSKILNGIRRIEGGELVTIAEVCEVEPAELTYL